MAVEVQFTDNSAKVKAALDEACIAYLYESAGELTAQTQRNTRVAAVGGGRTKNAWTYVVDESIGEATVGNPLENAIWEEFGTGEFALKGNGRKGGWVYKDDKGNFYHTFGKKPSRALHNAFTKLKNALIKRAEDVLKERMK